jgi:class 3 adenylate cyclase/tetratricopeptide (TPR) repeat protein
MQCTRCQHDNPAEAKFCNGCGTRLELACPQCKVSNPPGSRFCGQCATQLSSPGTTTSSPRFESPQAYTPKHLAEKILTSRSAIEGERKQVTVLFADLKGSMELLADRDPEEARKLIDPVIDQIMDAVHRYEGTVNHVMGDGVMAIFGAPLAHEDHAVRACYAALAVQSSIRAYSAQMRRSHGIEIELRIGLNSGEVVVGAIGNDLHMEYSAVGQTTHLAARMEQLATPGTVRLTAYTLGFAEGFIHVAPLGPVPVRGLAEPVEVYELKGVSGLRTRMQAAAARGLTRFVGRQAELEVLGQALKHAGAGHGQIVALVGEPGVGKSRLIWEFTHSHRTQGWLALESGSVSYGKATAYRPLIDLLKVYFRIEERDDARRLLEKITGKLLTLDKTLEPILPALLALLDVGVEDPEWQRLHPTQRRSRTLDACKRLLLRESQVQPLVLIFEDLHWIDSETQAFLNSLIESLPTSRILLLVNFRPEYQSTWGSKTYYAQLRVDPLPAESAEELLLGLLGPGDHQRGLRQTLIQRTEGNPFFLEESVRSLVEAGVLVGERGSYRLQAPLASIQVPGRVQAVLAARIDRLDKEDKRLLQIAAVIGKDVPFPLLQVIAELSPDELQAGLGKLQAAEFLYEARLFPDIEYTFKHALTHEVAYSSLLQERRRGTHAQIVAAMENLYASRMAEQLERLSHHAVRGEVWPRAVTYLHQSGVKALSRSANQEAVAYLDQALDALAQLPEARENIENSIDLRLELRNALHPLGEFERVVEILQRAAELAESVVDKRRQGRVLSYLAQSYRLRGDNTGAIDAGEKAVEIGRDFNDPGIHVPANFHLGQVLFHLGDHLRAIDFYSNNIKTLDGHLAKDRLGMAGIPLVFTRGHLSWSLAELGRFPEAIAEWQEAIRLSEEVKHPFSEAFAKYCGGFLYLRKGEIERAITQLEPGFALCQSMHLRLELPFVASFLGIAYAYEGRHSEGIAMGEQAVSEMSSLKIESGRSWIIGFLGYTYLIAGQATKAVELMQQALELAQLRGERGWVAWEYHVLGLARMAQGAANTEKAHALFEQAKSAAQELHLRPLLARSELSLGQLHRRAGQKDAARQNLESAVSLLKEMQMPIWLQRAESELQALS